MAACSDGGVQAHPDDGGRAPRVDDRAGEDGADNRADDRADEDGRTTGRTKTGRMK